MHDRLTPSDPYARLGVSPHATSDEISAAYRRLVRALHPDSADAPGDPGALHAVISAHRLLSDPEQRQSYDRSSRIPPAGRTRRPCPVCRGARIALQPCQICAGLGTLLSAGSWLREWIECTNCYGRGIEPTACRSRGATGITEHRH
jgi:DnaJ-class molecular chaperone